MIALYLLAAHLVGDFVLQTRWQAVGKFTDRALRTRHVAAYCVPFVPIALWRYWSTPYPWQIPAFLVGLAVLHWLTDSRRFTSTLGDCVGWYAVPSEANHGRITLNDERAVRDGMRVRIATTGQTGRALYEDAGDLVVLLDLPPNPWTPIPILIDQTLHVCQIAILAGLLLS